MIGLTRKGDRAAFGALYCAHVDLVRRYARRVAWDEHAADDLVAEAFLRTWLQLLAGRGPDREFGAYVRAAVLNIHLSQVARAKRVTIVADIELTADADPVLAERLAEHSPEDLAILELLTCQLNEALLSLPARWQTVLALVYLDDLPYAEVAPRMGLTVSATQQLSLRARAGFRRALTTVQRRTGDGDALTAIAALRQLRDARRVGVV